MFKCINNINSRIQKEICRNTLYKLKDSNLLNEYKNTKSVKHKISEISNLLTSLNISHKDKHIITNQLLNHIIPAGTKGVIKGNKFNNIVKSKLLNLNLDKNRFDLQFETKILSLSNITEIPDWYIFDKFSKKFLIGMNQLDLWNGGHQLNRGFKYIYYNKTLNINHKILCVICNDIVIKNINNKVYTLFSHGFTDNSICYLNNLENIIYLYFD